MTPGVYFNVGSTDACAPYTLTVSHQNHSLSPAQCASELLSVSKPSTLSYTSLISGSNTLAN